MQLVILNDLLDSYEPPSRRPVRLALGPTLAAAFPPGVAAAPGINALGVAPAPFVSSYGPQAVSNASLCAFPYVDEYLIEGSAACPSELPSVISTVAEEVLGWDDVRLAVLRTLLQGFQRWGSVCNWPFKLNASPPMQRLSLLVVKAVGGHLLQPVQRSLAICCRLAVLHINWQIFAICSATCCAQAPSPPWLTACS